MYTSNKCPRTNNVSNSYFWHCRLGHVNKNKINRLIKEDILEISDCESCLLNKMTKLPFKRKGEWASDVLGLIYSDVCGPMNIAVREKYYYFITFTGDLFTYRYVYLMKHKSESFEMFKWFHNEVEKQIGKSIKTLLSD